jgi:large-conductance mechanosensitive channel
MNYIILSIVAIILIALIIFLIKKNIQDEKKFEADMNQNYPHAKDAAKDIESEETLH